MSMKGHGVPDTERDEALHHLQRGIPYDFSQVKLLETALTHSSFVNERQEGGEHNERLEFLGDAVLELCVSEELYRRFPDAREGVLTAMRSRLVNQDNLAHLAGNIGLDKCLLLGRGEENQGGRSRDSILSDAFEALLGAIFLDGGFPAAQKAVDGLLGTRLDTPLPPVKGRDHKSLLQEVVQRLFKIQPVYTLVETSGPEHAKSFVVRLELPDGRVFSATGSSIKRAEQQAALDALPSYEQTDPAVR